MRFPEKRLRSLPVSNHAVVERAAREQASISETEAAIRLLRYSAKKGGLPPALTERLLSALWELEEIVREAKQVKAASHA